MLQKFIVYGLSFIVLAFSASPAFAQATATLSSTPGESGPTPGVAQALTPLPTTVSPTSPLYTDLLVHNLFHSFSCLAVGQSVIGQPCLTYQMTKNAQGAIQGIPVLSSVNTTGGVLGTTTSLIGTLYDNRPVRTADYLASVSKNFGPKEAQAQVVGSGAQVLNPILTLWQTSRNISYVIMIIIFIIIGLMIMFRNKINPQTVITAQAALPGLVIGLIMITFSFFFAGLISDMAFIGTNVVGYYFTAAQGKLNETAFNDQLNLSQKLSNSNILSILGALTGIVEFGDVTKFTSQVYDPLGASAKTAVHTLVFWLSAQFLSPLTSISSLSSSPWALILQPILSLIGGGITNAALGPVLGLVLSLAAALALLYAMLKLLFKLLMAWLTIIFLTISAPLQFLFASLPGRQGIATGWILQMLGNILIFPAIIAVIYFVAFLLGHDRFNPHCPKDNNECLIKVSALNPINNSKFVPPAYAADGAEIIGSAVFPLFGGIDLSFVKILLAFGALMALPTIPDIIIRTVGKMGQAGQMIGQEIMGGTRFGQGYAQRTYQAGLSTGQETVKGLTGETNINAQGEVYLSKQGVLRRGIGTVSAPGEGIPGQWHIPGTNKYFGGKK